ncbi:helix-turn-helix domain-containing protein [Paraburkholderia bengalensis]|uniref:Helix-turn-helix domain-containing protein n=1 Tax=Paraburkholderia bengalensis TaxID=2747562 RepID=A0ABU8J3L4_9BURK
MATVGVVADAFRLANEWVQEENESTCYELSLLSSSGGTVEVSFNLSIGTKKLDHFGLADFHALFVACPDDRQRGAYRAFVSWLSRQRSLTSITLTETPALTVASSWPPIPVLVFEERLDGREASRAAPIDMVLALIERDLGHEAARRVTRTLSPPVIEHARAEVGDLGLTTKQKVCESARWIRDNYSGPISVAHAAEYAAMSKRNYQRRFKAEFGITPLEYLLRTRFAAVCAMLEDTELPIDKIARWCGMGDGNRLGRIFKERYGVSPTQYRARKHIANGEAAAAAERRERGASMSESRADAAAMRGGS